MGAGGNRQEKEKGREWRGKQARGPRVYLYSLE